MPLEVENRRTHSSGRLRSISRSSGGGERFSVVGAIGCGDKKVSEKEDSAGRGELEMDDASEGEWVGGGGGTMVAVAVVEDASRAVSDGESNHHSKSTVRSF